MAATRVTRLPRLLFLTIVALEIAHAATAIVQHRVPATHDGFQYFTLQYFFLNNAIQGGGVAQWIPYMSHGTVATTWYGIQGSVLQNVLLPLGPLLGGVDLLAVFHLGLFVDAMVLLTGSWLLARRFFRTATVFFVCLCIVGSAVWFEQPYWNFRLYYALPLILELGHRFLETGRWRWFFLAVNLLALQTVGNLPYFVPLVSFVVAVYFAGFAAAHREDTRRRLTSLRWDAPAAAAILGGAASLAVAYASISIGIADVVTYSGGRTPDGTTTLDGFLTYGGATDAGKWADLVLNLSPSLDWTLYAGVLIAPLLLVGIIGADRARVHFVVVAVTLWLFSLGTFVAVAAFYVWPGMKYFRHIALVSPLVKVLFCFVAGIGFDWLFEWPPQRGGAMRRYVAIAAAAVLVAGAGLALSRASSGFYLTDRNTAAAAERIFPLGNAPISRRLRTSATIALIGAAIVAVAPFALGAKRFSRSRPAHAIALGGVLALTAADVYRFKFDHLFDGTDVVPAAARFVTRPATMPFPPRRDPDLLAATLRSPRLQATLSFNRSLLQHLQGRTTAGTQYWTNHLFLFTDEAGSSFRLDSWLRPLDQLMRLDWGAPLDDTATLPPKVDLGRLSFPSTYPGAGRIAGVTADKIRFFAHAYAVGSPAALVPLMTADAYAGNLLFVFPAASGQNAATPWAAQRSLWDDDSLVRRYEVLRFDANALTVRVDNPGPSRVWMTYADVWHRGWTAAVNGREVPVFRANMAYKAVLLDGGENLVEFRFGSRWFTAAVAMVQIAAVSWLYGVAALAASCLRTVETPDRADVVSG